jgi:PhnB protein
MAVKPIREGFHTITPYLMVQEADHLVEFVKQAFGATELLRGTGSAGGLHSEVRIGDSMVMIGGGGAWRGEPMPAAIYLYMDEVDPVYKRALQAGATSIMEPVDQPYGDRLAGVKDPFGNVWYIATHKQDVPS